MTDLPPNENQPIVMQQVETQQAAIYQFEVNDINQKIVSFSSSIRQANVVSPLNMKG